MRANGKLSSPPRFTSSMAKSKLPVLATVQACARRATEAAISQPSAPSMSSSIRAMLPSSSTSRARNPEKIMLFSVLVERNGDVTADTRRLKDQIEFTIEITLDAPLHEPRAEPAAPWRRHRRTVSFLPLQLQDAPAAVIAQRPADRQKAVWRGQRTILGRIREQLVERHREAWGNASLSRWGRVKFLY